MLFRSLQQFYDTPLTWGTLPAVLLSFCWLSLGSLLVGVGVALACAFVLKRFALALHAEQGERARRGEGGGWRGEVAWGALGKSTRAARAPLTPAAPHSRGCPLPPGPLPPPPSEHVHGDRALYEIAIVVMASYLAYLVAEVVGMSGIVALFFTGETRGCPALVSRCTPAHCTPAPPPLPRPSPPPPTHTLRVPLGICHAHYSFYNCSPPARTTLLWFFAFAAFACETFVFAYLGLQVGKRGGGRRDWGRAHTAPPTCSPTPSLPPKRPPAAQVATMQHEFDFGLVFSALPLAVLSRAANVFPCSQLINIGRRYKLPKNLQVGRASAQAHPRGGGGGAPIPPHPPDPPHPDTTTTRPSRPSPPTHTSPCCGRWACAERWPMGWLSTCLAPTSQGRLASQCLRLPRS